MPRGGFGSSGVDLGVEAGEHGIEVELSDVRAALESGHREEKHVTLSHKQHLERDLVQTMSAARRSYLYGTPPRYVQRALLMQITVPSSSAKMLSKAISSPSDSIIYDLEDSVPPLLKDQARENLTRHLNNHPPSSRHTVRINALGTPQFLRDIDQASWCPCPKNGAA